jgi:AraC-like DNA-binding protein
MMLALSPLPLRIGGYEMKTVLKKRLGIAMRYMMENFYENFTLDEVSYEARIDKWYLCRAFYQQFGMTPFRWLWLFRLYVAKEYMTMMPNVTMTHVAFSCGFKSVAHFSRFFKANVGCSPSAYQRSLSTDSFRQSYRFYTDLYDQENNVVVKKAYEKIINLHPPKF